MSQFLLLLFELHPAAFFLSFFFFIFLSYFFFNFQFLVRKQYYAYKQFTAFLRPGTALLPTGDASVLAGVNGQQLVVIVVNSLSFAVVKDFDLQHLSLGSLQPLAVNLTDAQNNCEAPSVPLVAISSETTFTIAAPTEAVVTAVFRLAPTSEHGGRLAKHHKKEPKHV